MEDELARARRAMEPVSDELTLTWTQLRRRIEDAEGEQADVVSEAAAEVVALTRPASRSRAFLRAGVAAGVVLVLGIQVVALLRLLDRPAAPPAASVTSSPVATNGDAAQVLGDVRAAIGGNGSCGVVLRDTADGQSVAYAYPGHWQDTKRVDDSPALDAALSAVRQLGDGSGSWDPRWPASGPEVVGDVAGTTVTVTIDAASWLPTHITPAGPGADFDLSWPSCAGG